MNKSIFNKQIPTALGLFIIIAGLSVTTFLTGKPTSFKIGAQENKQPLEVRITNIKSDSFTVSYKTTSIISGYLNYGKDLGLGQTAFDDNDISQKLQEHSIHSITVKNLIPQTKYYFSIISGGDVYLNNNQNFQITTSQNLINNSSDYIISGKIILPDSTAPKEAIIYITTGESQVLSAMTKNDGTYSINLKNLLTQDLSENFKLTYDSVIELFAMDSNFTSNVVMYNSQSKIIPVITLSNNYDFRTKQESTGSNTNTESFPLLNNAKTNKNIKKLQIVTPTNNQNLLNQKPIIKGLGSPYQNINLVIHSDKTIQVTTTTDSNGNWSYQPSVPLTPGTHTVTATGKDSNGVSSSVTQTFIVNDNATTSSADQISPTATPNTPQAIISAKPTDTTKSLPVGDNTSIITAGIVGLLITIVGSLIFLLSRRGI